MAAARSGGRPSLRSCHPHEHSDQDGDDGGDTTKPNKPKTKRRRRPSGADAKVILRVDYQALVRGHTLPGETCEITRIRPVSVDAARHWILDGAFVAAVLTHGTHLTTAVHLGRHPTALQTALQWIAPTCSVQGCNTTVRLGKDHTTDWATTHHTVLWALDHLCSHHHALETHHGYRLAPGTGTRPTLPPPDTHHAATPERPGEGHEGRRGPPSALAQDPAPGTGPPDDRPPSAERADRRRSPRRSGAG